MEHRNRRTIQLSVRLGMFVICLVAVFLLIGGAASADTPPGPTTEYVVVSGDTLWGIASRHNTPGDDVRVMVRQIRDLSGLESSIIVPGQVLRIPGA